MVRYRVICHTWIRGAYSVVESVLKIVGNEIGTLQKQIDVVGIPTFHTIRIHPGGVLWRGPVQLWHDFTVEHVNCALDSVVDISPPGCDICIRVIVVLSICVVRRRENATVVI